MDLSSNRINDASERREARESPKSNATLKFVVWLLPHSPSHFRLPHFGRTRHRPQQESYSKMAPPKIFYAPADPKMLTEYEISQMSSADVQAACDQIDQNMVGVLSKMDEEFSKANQILFERILPAVAKYGESSQEIWESVKVRRLAALSRWGAGEWKIDGVIGRQFWKSFFEASANTRLTPNAILAGDETTGEEESFDGEDPTLAANADESLSFDDTPSALELTIGAAPVLSKSTTAHPTTGKGKDVDPYDALQSDLSKIGISTTTKSQQEAVKAATINPGDSYRYRLGDMSIDSPDVPLPQFETYDDSTTSARMLINFSESPIASSIASPKSRSKAGMERVHPKLLEKILARNLLEGGGAGGKSSTPRSEFKKGGRKSLFPEDIPKDWNGIANLSSTKLDAFQSPIKRRFVPSTNPNATADLLQFDSPAVPLTMQYSNDQHNMTSTPTRPESNARSFVEGVYQFEESPVVEPPSVMKNWATRGYDDLLSAEVVSPLGAKEGEVVGEGSRRGYEEEDEPIARTSIFGEGAGTTARIDELLEGNSFARILDDDEQEAQFGMEEEEGTGGFQFQGDEEGDEGSFADEGLSVEEGYQPIENPGHGRAGLEVPEDTLFGMPQRRGGEEDSFEGEKKGFKLQGMSEMDTLHGGQLLDSVPFEASPLANRGRD